MAPLVSYLHVSEDMSSSPRTEKPGTVVLACNHSPGEVELFRLWSSLANLPSLLSYLLNVANIYLKYNCLSNGRAGCRHLSYSPVINLHILE